MKEVTRWRTLGKIAGIVIAIPAFLFSAVIVVAYFSQDKIVQTVLNQLNTDFAGHIKIQDSHISPFVNFPYISIDLQGLHLYEGKSANDVPILDVNDVYVGFNFWTIIRGNYHIKTIKLVGGHIHVVQHLDGSFNLLNALESKSDETSTATYLDLKSISIKNMHVTKTNEASALYIDADVNASKISFRSKANHIYMSLDGDLMLSVIQDSTPTFFSNKHIELHTKFDYIEDRQLLTVLPSEIKLEKALFGVEGSIDLDDDANMKLKFTGNKPNFDLFIAFAPEELIPALKKYDNTGKIFFEASVEGKTLNGHQPRLEVNFGCEQAVFSNVQAQKQLNNLSFKAHFTNGEDRTPESMVFTLTEFSADPDAGFFKGDLTVKNFISPDIQLRLEADFELDFLAKFLNYEDLQDLKGRVQLAMNFRDIIDLANPEKSIERLNESYFTEINVTNLSFKSPKYHLPVEKINIKAKMDGHQTDIERFDLKVGETDISAKGFISDLPALLHQTAIPVIMHLDLNSNKIDLAGLSNRKDDTSTIDRLRLSLDLQSSGKAIVDFLDEEKSLQRTHEPHYSKLRISDLNFSASEFHLPVKMKDALIEMKGAKAVIDHIYLQAGRSDLTLSGSISDLPSVLHHTDHLVKTNLNISTKGIDLEELTTRGLPNEKPITERIEYARANLGFVSSAKALTESPNLPVGEFFIYDLFARLKGYPHELHDFRADVLVTDNDFKVIDFSGFLDSSDFHFNGNLKNYPLFLKDSLRGDVVVKYDLKSKILKLHDIFTYEGENHVPEEYRHEEIKDLGIKGNAALHFSEAGLYSSDIYIDGLSGQFKIHPLPLKDFKGRIHIEDEHIVTQNFSGSLGESSFLLNLNYYYGDNIAIKKRDNHLVFKAEKLNFDELMLYNPPPEGASDKVDHDSVFSVFDIPFPEMKFDVNIKHLNYHKYLIKDFVGTVRTHPDHTLHIDAMSLKAAGGEIGLKGYFNGSNRSIIYARPQLSLKNVDLDQLLFKFDNFGQDHLVSENLHGRLTGSISGKVYLHADLTPIVDKSELDIDILISEGMIENFGPLDALADFFRDKNLKKVRFGDLKNQFAYKNGVMQIPKMTINTSLGFLEISGKQDIDMNMEYYVRVPWRMVTSAGFSKLFGGKKKEEVDPDTLDDIEYLDEEKRVRFVNVKISGNADNFKVSLGKDKR
jgi:hypothetical protein